MIMLVLYIICVLVALAAGWVYQLDNPGEKRSYMEIFAFAVVSFVPLANVLLIIGIVAAGLGIDLN